MTCHVMMHLDIDCCITYQACFLSTSHKSPVYFQSVDMCVPMLRYFRAVLRYCLLFYFLRCFQKNSLSCQTTTPSPQFVPFLVPNFLHRHASMLPSDCWWGRDTVQIPLSLRQFNAAAIYRNASNTYHHCEVTVSGDVSWVTHTTAVR